MMRLPGTVLVLLSAIAGLASAPVYAQDDLYAPGGGTLLDLGQYRTAFQYPDGDHEAHVDRYGVGFYEPLTEDSSDLTYELHGGYLSVDVDGEPPVSPFDYSGRYLGVGLRYQESDGDYLNWAAEFSYTWNDTTAEGSQVLQSEIQWYEVWAAAGPVFRLGPWRLALGAYWQHLDGTETDSDGEAPAFGARKSLGGYLGVDLYTERSFSIGIYTTAGARQGTRLVFRKYF